MSRNYTELDQNHILQRAFEEDEDRLRVTGEFSSLSGDAADGFGRLRVSSPFGILDNKNVLEKNAQNFEELTASGGSVSYSVNESVVTLSVGTTSGAYAIRQSIKRCPYVPGKSHLINMTGIIGASKTNLVSRIGYFDNNDGLFFEMNSTGISVVIRSSTSGSPVDTVIPQSSWNIDKADGTGASGFTFDPLKCQLFTIDFQWLGVGRVRFGLNHEGATIIVHEVYHANNSVLPYMKTPTLPVRYEIRNLNTTASSSSIKEICASVATEGGYNLPGNTFSALSTAYRNVGTSFTPVFAIRLKSLYNGVANRKLIKLLTTTFLADSGTAIIKISKVFTPTTSTATWTSAGATSGVEYSTDITAYTGGIVETVYSTFAIGGSGIGTGGSSSAQGVQVISENSQIFQNHDSSDSQMFVVEARSLAITVNLLTSLEWIEFV